MCACRSIYRCRRHVHRHEHRQARPAELCSLRREELYSEELVALELCVDMCAHMCAHVCTHVRTHTCVHTCVCTCCTHKLYTCVSTLRTYTRGKERMNQPHPWPTMQMCHLRACVCVYVCTRVHACLLKLCGDGYFDLAIVDADMCIDIRREMCIGMCTEMCLDMCTGMCLDMCA